MEYCGGFLPENTANIVERSWGKEQACLQNLANKVALLVQSSGSPQDSVAGNLLTKWQTEKR